jgi:hypothetical protein
MLSGNLNVGLSALHVVSGICGFADNRPVLVQNLDQDLLWWSRENEVDSESVIKLKLRVGRALGTVNQIRKLDGMGGNVFRRERGDDGIEDQSVVAVLRVFLQNGLEDLCISLVRNALQNPL